MIIKTNEILSILRDEGIERDDNLPFSEHVGYREINGGRWFVFDESSTETDTIFLLEDLGTSENYTIAAKVKALEESKQKKQA
jgi:hypothetical protein